MSLSSNFPTSKPSLNLDFANVGALDPRITFTRSSSATYTNSLGLIATAATNVARFDYDPTTLAARGLLIEEQRTNIYTYSEDFSNAAWSKTGTTVIANSTGAPDGLVTADEITFGTGTSALVQTKSGLSAGARYEPSVYIKRITTSGQIIIRNTEDGSYGRWAVNLALLGSGWERITRSHAAVTVTAEFVAAPSGVCAPAFYGSDSNIKAYLWGAQLEAGTFSTSYIPTPTNSTVTRSADVASVNTLSPWWNASAATFYIENSFGSFYNQPIALSDQAGAGNAWIYGAISPAGLIKSFTVGALVDLSSGVTVAANSTVKSAFAYGASGKAISVNGSTPVVSGNTTAPTASTQLSMGGWPGGPYYINGHIRRVAYYPRALSTAELQALTS